MNKSEALTLWLESSPTSLLWNTSPQHAPEKPNNSTLPHIRKPKQIEIPNKEAQIKWPRKLSSHCAPSSHRLMNAERRQLPVENVDVLDLIKDAQWLGGHILNVKADRLEKQPGYSRHKEPCGTENNPWFSNPILPTVQNSQTFYSSSLASALASSSSRHQSTHVNTA
jgi:hypothetical protein